MSRSRTKQTRHARKSKAGQKQTSGTDLRHEVTKKKEQRRMSPTGTKPQPTSERQTTRPEKKLRRVLNLPLAIGTLLTVVVLAPSLYFLHSRQIKRMASRSLVRADELAAKEEWARASRLINDYLRIRPNDVEQRIKLAETFAKTVSESPENAVQAIAIYRHAVSVLQSQPEKQIRQRRYLIKLLLQTGQFRKAEIEVLAQPAQARSKDDNRHFPSNATDQRILAQALYGRFTDGAITGPLQLAWPNTRPKSWKNETWALGEILTASERSNPNDARIVVPLARLYREHSAMLSATDRQLATSNRNEFADQLIVQMHQASPVKEDTLLKAHTYFAAYDHANAKKSIEQLLELGPDSPQVLLAAARFARLQAAKLLPNGVLSLNVQGSVAAKDLLMPEVRRLLDESEAHFRSVIERDPSIAEAYFELGDLLRRQGKQEEGVAILEQGAEEHPKAPILLAILIDSLLNVKKTDGIEVLIERFEFLTGDSNPLRIKKNSLLDLQRMGHLNRGKRLLLLDKPAEAVHRLRQALPGLSQKDWHRTTARETNRLLAHGYRKLKMWDQVAQAEEAVVELESPENAVSNRLAAAEAWRRAGQPDRAIVHYQMVIRGQNRPEKWLQLAQTILESNSQKPVAEQDWLGFEIAMKNAAEPAFQSVDPKKPAWVIEFTKAHGKWIIASQTGKPTARENTRNAIQLTLTELGNRYANEPEYWQAAATLYQLIGLSDEAWAACDVVQRIGDPERALAIKVRILLHQNKAQQAKTLILENLKSWPEAKKAPLRQMLAEVIFADSDQVSTEIGSVDDETLSTLDIPMLLQLAEFDVATGDARTLKWLEQLKRKEGPHGSTWKYIRGRWLLFNLGKENAPLNDRRIDEVIQIQSELQRTRPNWSATYLLAGLLAEGNGRLDDAINAYQHAIDLGERRVFVFERLVKLMWQTENTEVETVLMRLGSHVSTSQEMTRIGILSANRNRNLPAAEDRARAAVSSRPADALARMWLALVLEAQGMDEKAEIELNRAAELEPTDARMWTSLIMFCVRKKQFTDAQTAMEQLKQLAEFSTKAQREFVLGQLERHLGSPEKAQQRFAQAAELAEDDKLKSMALVHGASLDASMKQIDKAVNKLQLAVNLAPSNAEIRRMLATTLAARGKVDDYDRAFKLLEQDEVSKGSVSNDRRLKGLLLSRRADGSYRENTAIASQIYELIVSEMGEPADRVFLADLSFIRSQLEPPVQLNTADVERFRIDLQKKADKNYAAALRTDSPNARVLIKYLRYLLFQGRREAALRLLPHLRIAIVATGTNEPARLARYGSALWSLGFERQASSVGDDVERLRIELGADVEKADCFEAISFALTRKDTSAAMAWLALLKSDQSLSLAHFGLEIKIRAAQSDKYLETTINDFAAAFLAKPENMDRKALLFKTLSILAGQVELHEVSEQWARRLFDLDPRSYPLLVTSLAEQKKTDVALAVCIEALSDNERSDVVIVAVSMLFRSDSQDVDLISKVEQLIQDSLTEDAENLNLLTAVATLRAKQQRIDEATQLFQRALELSPRDALVLNNLATLLGETTGKSEQAIQYVDYALMYAGISGALLDTKGTVLIRAGRFVEAVRVLEMACRSPQNHDPRVRFHLAVALDGLGESQRARQLLSEVLQDGLEEEILTPTDKADLTRIWYSGRK